MPDNPRFRELLAKAETSIVEEALERSKHFRMREVEGLKDLRAFRAILNAELVRRALGG